jgi:hypothetical protein
VLANCGRDIGKTEMCYKKAHHRFINFPRGSLMWTSFDLPHVIPRVVKIFAQIDAHPLLSMWKSSAVGARSTKPPLVQKFTNGFEFWGIGANEQGQGRQTESPHVMGYIMDEGQFMGWTAVGKLKPAINDQELNRGYGSMRMVVGVNSEGATDSWFYDRAHSKDSEFHGHVYRFPSWYNPRNYTLAKHTENLRDYGGSIEASKFRQMIRGLDGDADRGVIPPEAYEGALEIGRRMELRAKNIKITKQMWTRDSSITNRLGLRFLEYPATFEDCVIAADFGTTSATEIGIWFRTRCNALEGAPYVWLLWGRITLLGFDPAVQAEIFDTLGELYQPTFISIDSTAATNPVTAILLDPRHPAYNSPIKNYSERIFEAKFNIQVPGRYAKERPDNAGTDWKRVRVRGEDMWALMVPANEFATDKIVRMLLDKYLALPEDDDMQKDCLGLRAITNGGRTAYRGPRGQHVVSMFRAFTLLVHVKYELDELAERAARAGYTTTEECVGYYLGVDLN